MCIGSNTQEGNYLFKQSLQIIFFLPSGFPVSGSPFTIKKSRKPILDLPQVEMSATLITSPVKATSVGEPCDPQKWSLELILDFIFFFSKAGELVSQRRWRHLPVHTQISVEFEMYTSSRLTWVIIRYNYLGFGSQILLLLIKQLGKKNLGICIF